MVHGFENIQNLRFLSDSDAWFSFDVFLTARNSMICWNFVTSEIIFGIINSDVVMFV